MQHAEQHLSAEEIQALRNKRTALSLFQISWIMVFVSLVVANLQLRGQAATWPPPGVEALGTTLPTVITFGLILSSFLARRASRALKSERLDSFLLLWRAAIGLGALFVAVMAAEWLRVPVTGQYSTLFRLMVGFHSFHALVIGGILVFIEFNARAGKYGGANFWPVEAAAKLWYFVTVAWLLFYAFIYWL